MVATFIILSRETLEASLVVGILLTYLNKISRQDSYRYVWAGTGLGIVTSVLFAYATAAAGEWLSGVTGDWLQVAVLFIAVAVLTSMIIWMHHHARSLRGSIERKADTALSSGRLWALGLLAFTGVFREGAETVLFLWGLVLQLRERTSGMAALVGGLLGVIVAVLIAWVFFQGFRGVDLRRFFRWTGILLIFLAAGLLSTGVGRLEGLGVLPPWVPTVWDTTRLLDDRGAIGSILAGLLGYKARPSLWEALAYFLYLGTALALFGVGRDLWGRLSRLRPAVKGL